ncbi:BEN domain-containing protein 6-like [Neoarius graeffei]|uniref:BEN domain-containing protein 6-like n=1 Tax=Neoarius graeffei TaxID=443677 RepID=UPI00298C898D|nr:BEN domain-containing protein 6-like [Neoarius graeffei]
MVRWGKDLYPAKILDMSENEQTLVAKREELINASGAEECGRGRQRKKPTQYSSEDEEQLRKKGEEQVAGKDCSKCKRLEQRVRELEEDRQRLSRQLDTFNDLRNMLAEVLASHRQPSPDPNQPAPNQPSPAPNQPSPANQEQANDDVVIGGTLKVNKIKLQRCNHQLLTKLVCDLLGVVFSKREMATSSLTGQKGSAKDEIKPPLEATAVKAIFEYTLQKFPNVELSILRGAVRNKLNNVSKLFKKTQAEAGSDGP